MTKSHPMHRKKAIHMTFRRSSKVRRVFWRVVELIDKVSQEKEVNNEP